MAQTGYTPISLYYSTTASAAPTAVNLVAGELALNTVDEKLYFKNSSGVVKLLASNSGSLGSVTSVAQSFTGGLISVSGSPITSSGTLALTVAGTSGGVPYFSSSSTWASSAALAANSLVIGGGAGAAPSTITTGTGVVTALGVNTGTAGAFVVNGGALGTPSSGTLTSCTGLPLTTGVTGTLPVANGGTGATSATAYAVLCGGTTSTSAYQSVASVGTAGQVLTSNGAGALPTFQTSAGGFAAGTAMLFAQTAAPTGWTKSTTHDNKALRVVSGTASSGGSVAFTTAFASQSVSGTVGSTTLDTTQIPSHSHTFPIYSVGKGTQLVQVASGNSAGNYTTNSTGGGGSHNHSFTGTAINLAVQYVDVIIATKD